KRATKYEVAITPKVRSAAPPRSRCARRTGSWLVWSSRLGRQPAAREYRDPDECARGSARHADRMARSGRLRGDRPAIDRSLGRRPNMRSRSPRKSALRLLLAPVALAALGLGWFGLHASGGSQPLASIAIPMNAPEDLPDTPTEWRGRVDYEAIDRQLTDLSRRPEMAGLAVAVVEDGKLRFVRTYGVADRSTGAPVTPQTLFRWASVSKTATGVLAAAMARDGTIDLDRPITQWRTSLHLPGGAEARVTLDQ